MSKKIVCQNSEGKFVITIPSRKFIQKLQLKNPDWDEERCLQHIADKDLVSGTQYSIVTHQEFIDAFGEIDGAVDQTFFHAWEYTAPEDALTSNDLSDEDLITYNMTGQAT
jgi:hypothetical protein